MKPDLCWASAHCGVSRKHLHWCEGSPAQLGHGTTRAIRDADPGPDTWAFRAFHSLHLGPSTDGLGTSGTDFGVAFLPPRSNQLFVRTSPAGWQWKSPRNAGAGSGTVLDASPNRLKKKHLSFTGRMDWHGRCMGCYRRGRGGLSAQATHARICRRLPAQSHHRSDTRPG